ncbi:MAG: glycosyltransferase [Clostridiales bacterium]|nr:glycosyltransferase [Clostridiales bacterium]
MKEPLITIVVPVYKVPYDMLHKCLDSIAGQTSKNFEALLIDDGSPDDCGRICDEYAEKFPFFRVIHKQNGGLSVVRNTGIKNAEGKWICFVDGDDWIEPETIEFAEKYTAECKDGDVLIWEEFYDVGSVIKENLFVEKCDDGKIHKFDRTNMEKLIDMFFPVVFKSFPKNYVDVGTCNARLYRREFLNKYNLRNVPGLKRMQDNEFNLRVLEKASVVYYCCKRLYHYSFNEEAATQKYAPQNAAIMNFLYECIKKYVEEFHNDNEYHQRLYSRFIRIFGEIFKLNYANPNNPNKLRKRLIEAKREFSSGNFREVIDNFEPKPHSRKTKMIHRLLKGNHYLILIGYYSLSIRTRKLRLKLRK